LRRVAEILQKLSREPKNLLSQWWRIQVVTANYQETFRAVQNGMEPLGASKENYAQVSQSFYKKIYAQVILEKKKVLMT